MPYEIDKKNSTGKIIQTWLNEFLIGYFTTHIFAQILGHLKTINFPFGTNGKLMVLGVPTYLNTLG